MNFEALEFYSDLPKHLKTLIKKHAKVEDFPINTMITGKQQSFCESLFIVLRGKVRVFKISDQGKEVTLYDVYSGSLCLKNLSCILNNGPYEAQAITKENTQIVVIPKKIVLEHLLAEESFVKYMVQSTLNKIEVLMDHYEYMSFAPVKTRLRVFLIQASNHYQKKILYLTHEAIALEIGTSREVISRVLKEWEKQDFIELSRGKIKILKKLD